MNSPVREENSESTQSAQTSKPTSLKKSEQENLTKNEDNDDDDIASHAISKSCAGATFNESIKDL